ncbi:ABC transporter ATP-binding protein [Nostocoides australiense]|uniref:ABC transporter related protein n=1 Tax=Nostocoides australiense Ben110 TaxID=1193182 RepID=W6K0Q5_9MICO|nr:ABC transporter ATP-binding protein [Tetrasphaera australiensis]MCB1300039.1 ABC transporter ATP-binding protein [Tetrasphaera sp.]CCH75453.1 ABC transporter related protein [Tetrasphaera australiensis Ben110]HPF81115.1 ABC transporter ATP-binding protein [Tetrasphaera australiensis]HRW01974.1 ABC transporter ATP-binding protein [Tetrasphaera sp.]
MAAPDTPAGGRTSPVPERRPAAIVSHLDIIYRVVGGKRSNTSAIGDDEGESIFRNLIGRGKTVATVQSVHAVKDVSFVAYHGESVGIIGRNGSGKSTLLRAVAGLLPPTNGEVFLAGTPALLGVNAVLMSALSGERNIYIGGQALGLTKAQVKERFEEIVAFSGIGDAVYRPMSTYSSGMAARLRFAISTAAVPDVLMIDEALSTGDAEFRKRSGEKVDEIREKASTVFLVSHSNSTVRDLCDRVLWMHHGRLIADGPTEAILTAYEGWDPKKHPAGPPGIG